ncbi:protein PML-like [Indicator indicator]|uniref:protein PML-like n=1 Tax=Indicator indicator TaxID=1002788 RepID=UPI0023DE9587|nr:protein PML-like [Indicator indicator]
MLSAKKPKPSGGFHAEGLGGGGGEFHILPATFRARAEAADKNPQNVFVNPLGPGDDPWEMSSRPLATSPVVAGEQKRRGGCCTSNPLEPASLWYQHLPGTRTPGTITPWYHHLVPASSQCLRSPRACIPPGTSTPWYQHPQYRHLPAPPLPPAREAGETKVSIEPCPAPPPTCPTALPPRQQVLQQDPSHSSHLEGDRATAPMEKGPETAAPSCSTPSHPPAVEDDFQFVLCERCRQESPNLKLLTCLHSLCLDCLSENKPVGQCPLCQTPIPQANGIPDMDNLLYINLQARLKVYRKIRDSQGPSCSRCREQVAAVWCSECEEFLCAKCFEDHQWFFKKRSHEARRVEDLRAESANQFLEDTKKSSNLFCSRPGHADQGHVSSIYCQRCAQALCCSCALLDSQHAPFCDIRSETQRRQRELDAIGQQLRRGRSGFEEAAEALRAQAGRLEEARRQTRELIRQRAEQLVALIRREEEELLGLLEARQEQGRGRLERELRRLEGVLLRLEAGERLVEKMGLYATEQEVMDMQPFIKGSLQELQQLRPPAAQEPVPPGDFAECRARLQALVERVTGRPDTNSQAVPMVEVDLENDLQEEPVQAENQPVVPTFTISLEDMQESMDLPVTTWPKRKSPCMGRGTQVLPKVLKLESDHLPAPSDPSSDQWDGGRRPGASTPEQNCCSVPATSRHLHDAEDTSIIICSSDDSSEDTVTFIKPEDIKKSSSPIRSEGGTSPHNSPWSSESELSTLVFLCLKADQKTQQITEVAAANGENCFRALIQTPESVLALLSQGVPMEVGVQHLLWYLSALPRPILVVYNFWARELPALFKALDATSRKVDFCHAVGGYVDMLSLVKEKLPRATSYRLKNLLRGQLQLQLKQASALATAKGLQELWASLELPARVDKGMVLSHCNLQSYTMLLPLLREKLLTRRAAKVLARRNLILWELEEV